jgi:hypothetical protein
MSLIGCFGQIKSFGHPSLQECFPAEQAEIKLAYVVKETAKLLKSLPSAGYACHKLPNECVAARR